MLSCTQMSCSIISDLEIFLIRIFVIYYVIKFVLLYLSVSYIGCPTDFRQNTPITQYMAK